MSKKIFLYLLIVSVALSLTACSEFNLFGWVHKKGSSNDTDVLISDGEVALNKKDYDSAETYFGKVLEQEPNNSVALYGYSAAVLGGSGLGLADIISSVIQEASSGSPSPVINQSDYANLFSPAQISSNMENLIPETLDLKKLYDTAKKVIPKLKKIADGEGNGIIPADDVDVNINLAILLAIRAACGLLDTNGDGEPGGIGDLVEVYSDYSVELPTQADLDALTEEEISSMRDQVQDAIWDIVGGGSVPYDKGAVDYILAAIDKIGAKSGSALSDLKNNIDEFESDKDEGIAALKDLINEHIANNNLDVDPIE